MSIENLFDHRCNIYHIVTTVQPAEYGLPSQNEYTYPEVADEADVPCHFKSVTPSVTIVQAEPNSKVMGDIILKLPMGTDIRLNDKVVDSESGFSFKAHVPRSIRGHHIMVKLQLEENL